MIFLPNLTFSSVCMDKIQTQDSVKHHLSAQFSNHGFFFFVGLECLFLFFLFFYSAAAGNGTVPLLFPAEV